MLNLDSDVVREIPWSEILFLVLLLEIHGTVSIYWLHSYILIIPIILIIYQ